MIASALKSKNAWRSLKTLGNSVRFQFLLPDELEAVVASNKGIPVGKRMKQKLGLLWLSEHLESKVLLLCRRSLFSR